MADIASILLKDLYNGADVVPTVPSKGLGAMTGRNSVTTEKDTQDQMQPSGVSAVADYVRSIFKQQVDADTSIAASAKSIPFDPSVDDIDSLVANGYNPEDVLKASIATGSASATGRRSIRSETMDDLERLVRETQEARKPKTTRRSVSSQVLDMLATELNRGMTSKQTDTQPTVSADSGRDRFELQGEMRDIPVLEDEDVPELDTRSNELLDKELPSAGLGSRPVAEEQPDALSIPSNIDMSFLGAKEGFKLNAYIPEDKDGKVIDKSGVTIGTGVDLGSKNAEYFEGLDPAILDKLTPHFGKKKEAAQESLRENAFSLTDDEAIALDNFVKAKEFNVLTQRWNKDAKVKWDELPSNQATAVASLYYQHGNQTFGYDFWDQITSGDWDSAYDNLMSWGGSTPSRRRDEAKLLKTSN